MRTGRLQPAVSRTSATDVHELRANGVQLREAATVSPVAWEPCRSLDLEEWLLHGRRMGSIGRGCAWWVGDWVNYGNTRFGEKYLRASRITGYDVQTLMNMAYIASRFEFSRRRENLSWSHHAEIAALPVAEQEKWLDLAVREKLSVHRLRGELRKSRQPAQPRPPADKAVADVCPRCGQPWQQP